MFAGAARREFDLLLVWSLDRFSREGIAATIGHLQRLNSHGVGFHSFTEEHLSTDNELVRNILLATLASLAKLEREKISQRTKAGLDRARPMGRRLGRPKFSDGDRQKLQTALDTGGNWHPVSIATKIPYSTVRKHARDGVRAAASRCSGKWQWLMGRPRRLFVSGLCLLKIDGPPDCKIDPRFCNPWVPSSQQAPGHSLPLTGASRVCALARVLHRRCGSSPRH